MQRAALAQRHADQRALGRLGRLADRFRHFARLAVAEADAALLVADDHQRGEAEPPAALHHLGDAVDVDQLVDELAVARLRGRDSRSPLSGLRAIVLMSLSRLELQAAFAGGVGQRLDAAVIDVAAAVEHHLRDAGLLGALGDQLADRRGGRLVGAVLSWLLQSFSSVEAAASVSPFASSMIWA